MVVSNLLLVIRKKNRIHKRLAKFLLITSNIYLLITVQAQTRNLGIHGIIYPIEEEDPLVLIQKKLKFLEETGDLERHNKELQRKTKSAIERPKPVLGITHATEFRVFYYDPTYVVNEDLRDHQGQIIYRKGIRINPLETVNLSKSLLFIDGDDVQQKAWALEKIKEKQSKLILMKGAPLALSEELGVPVYFDQAGKLTQKLEIHHVPAEVNQEGFQLRIEEVFLPSKEKKVKEGDLP